MFLNIKFQKKGIHKKNDFTDGFKSLTGYRSKNNFVRTLKIMNNNAKSFNILAISLNVQHNYFNTSTKLFFWYIFWMILREPNRWLNKGCFPSIKQVDISRSFCLCYLLKAKKNRIMLCRFELLNEKQPKIRNWLIKNIELNFNIAHIARSFLMA